MTLARTFARRAAVVLSAGVLLVPAPAMAAVAGHHPHGHGHHAPGGQSRPHAGHRHEHAGHVGAAHKAHFTHRLAAVRQHLAALRHAVTSASLSNHQRAVLTHRFSAVDDLSGVDRALHRAHTDRQLARVAARIDDLAGLVPDQLSLVRWLAGVDASRHHWHGIQKRLGHDDQCLQENEEDSQLMADFDAAVTDLDAAAETLASDEQTLLAASGRDDAAVTHALHRVLGYLDRVSRDLLDAVRALRDLESRLGG